MRATNSTLFNLSEFMARFAGIKLLFRVLGPLLGTNGLLRWPSGLLWFPSRAQGWVWGLQLNIGDPFRQFLGTMGTLMAIGQLFGAFIHFVISWDSFKVTFDYDLGLRQNKGKKHKETLVHFPHFPTFFKKVHFYNYFCQFKFWLPFTVCTITRTNFKIRIKLS
jgi:hypothetical protein